jgi:hypothetical protein
MGCTHNYITLDSTKVASTTWYPYYWCLPIRNTSN